MSHAVMPVLPGCQFCGLSKRHASMAECITALRDKIARLEMLLTTVRGNAMGGRVGRKPKEQS